jgi:serine protease Do
MRFLTLTIMLILTVLTTAMRLDAAMAVSPSTTVSKPMLIHTCHVQKQYQLPRDLNQVLRSVVIVQNQAKIGSGVIISDEGYILTAAHLITNAERVAVYLNSGGTVAGEVLRVDLQRDVALVKIPDKHYPCLPVMTHSPAVGSRICSLGFSLEGKNGFVMQEGKVKNNRFAQANGPFYVQTTLDLKPGHSGGPLLNRFGQVAGIISWKIHFADSRVFSFGTPINAAQPPMKISWKN